jgi:hypothetical protein
MRLALALAVMRCAEPGLVESLHVTGAVEIAELACDLRKQLVQWVRDAAHSPDARAELCRILCMYIGKTHDSYLVSLSLALDHVLLLKM